MRQWIVGAVVAAVMLLGWTAQAQAQACPLSTDADADALNSEIEGLKKKRQEKRVEEAKNLVNTARTKALDDGLAKLRTDGVQISTTLTELEVLARSRPRLLDVQTPLRVAIQLSNPPSGRLRVSFDAKSGLHQEADWDPAVSSQLLRFVVLEKGLWTVSVVADPFPYTQQLGVVVIQTRFDELRSDGAERAKIEGTYVALAAAASTPISDPKALPTWPRPTLTFDCNVSKTSMESQQFATSITVNNNGLRGFGVAPTFVTDTLSILAEIAMERAKSGALRLVKKRIVDPFCSKNQEKPGVTLRRLRLGGDELAFPRTCVLLDGLRLEDIMASGRALLNGLRDDLRYTIVPAAIAKLGGGGAAGSLLQSMMVVLNTAIDRGGFDGLEAQLLLDAVGNFKDMAPTLDASMKQALLDGLKNDSTALANVTTLADKPFGEWVLSAAESKPIVDEVHKVPALRKLIAHACQARLAIAVIKRCSAGGCNVSQIAQELSAPESVFEVDDKLPFAVCWSNQRYLPLEGTSAKVQQFVVEGLKLLAPVADAQGKDRAKAAVRLTVQLAKLWRGGDSTAADRLDAFSETAIALIDEDYGTAITRALAILTAAPCSQLPGELTKMTQLLGAVAAYAAVYRSTKEEDPKAAHEARKKALLSIIDSATDRETREDDWITSLGSNVGLSATWSTPFRDSWEPEIAPSVRLPLALRAEWFPEHGEWWGGWHVAVQVADLGQFVRRDSDGELGDVHWADFVSPGIEVGYNLAGLGDRALNVSLHLAYAPALEQAEVNAMGNPKDGAWRFGVALSYYVPFFDFN